MFKTKTLGNDGIKKVFYKTFREDMKNVNVASTDRAFNVGKSSIY